MESRLLIGVIATFVTIIGVQGECPTDFIHLGKGCYYFSQDPLVNEEASSYCLGKGLGIDLVAFETCAEFTQVSRYLEVAGLSPDGVNFWTGAFRNGEIWAWLDSGVSLAYGAPLWNPFALTRNTSNCALIPANGGYLLPEDCTAAGYPLCKAQLSTKGAIPDPQKTPKKVECPEPFIAVGDRCFHVNKESHTWEGSRNDCASLAPDYYADLAVLSDCDIYTGVVRYLEETQTDIADWLWVGAKENDEGSYRWLSGDYIPPGVPFWCPGQPDNFAGEQHCTILWGPHFYYGADEDCTSLHRSLCEIGL